MCDYGVGSCPIRRGTGHNSAVSPGRIGAGNRFAALAMEVGRPRYGAKGVGNTYPYPCQQPHYPFRISATTWRTAVDSTCRQDAWMAISLNQPVPAENSWSYATDYNALPTVRRHFVRTLITAVLACQLISCGVFVSEPAEPQYERGYFVPLRTPPAVFASMDLPYYGGQIERVTDSYMQVSYGREATVDQLKEWWPEAVKAEGWTPVDEQQKENGGFAGQYRLVSGGTASLTINPLGMLWMVDLTVYPPE
jgi:hypothetical protein